MGLGNKRRISSVNGWKHCEKTSETSHTTHHMQHRTMGNMPSWSKYVGQEEMELERYDDAQVRRATPKRPTHDMMIALLTRIGTRPPSL
mmetsp:Transcript_95716/g.252938  ORF Transcript_95716/g.252938 Transcript_95716/m.252938 type:complete len:89 (-) Transcript_95716:800-1066(-)